MAVRRKNGGLHRFVQGGRARGPHAGTARRQIGADGGKIYEELRDVLVTVLASLRKSAGDDP
jgi:hypothetical protein